MIKLNFETKCNSGKFKTKYDLEYSRVTGGINKCSDHCGGGWGECVKGMFRLGSKGLGKGTRSTCVRNELRSVS